MKALLENIDVANKVCTFRADRIATTDIVNNRSLLGEITFGARGGLVVGEIVKADVDRHGVTIKTRIKDQKAYEMLATGVLPTLAIVDGGTNAFLTDHLPDDVPYGRTFKLDKGDGFPLTKRFVDGADKDTRVAQFLKYSRNARAIIYRKEYAVQPKRVNANAVRIMQDQLAR